MCCGEASLIFGHANANFSVFADRIYKESISKEMDNDSDLNLHNMTKFWGWLCYWLCAFMV